MSIENRGVQTQDTLVEHAAELAKSYHGDQLYGDLPYFEAHLEPVAHLIRDLGYGAEVQAAGLLHDSIEDTSATPDKLLKNGIPQNVIDMVLAVTVIDGESHEDYLQRISRNSGAIVVKFCDSSLNFSNTVLGSADMRKDIVSSWVNKYSANIAFLHSLLPEPPLV